MTRTRTAAVFLVVLFTPGVGGSAARARIAPQASTFLHDAQLVGHGEAVGGGGYAGYSVAVSADTAVVGAPFDGTGAGVFVGTAQVFVRSGTTWTVQQKLAASDGGPGQLFGTSAAISGDTLVVGAPAGDPASTPTPGWAYVFVRSGTTWTEQQKLVASDGQLDDRFGTAVAISGDTIVVGAPRDDTVDGADAGSAYVFVRSGNTWSEQQKILPANGAANRHFGASTGVDGDTLLAGADAAAAGSAYVFVRSGTAWSQQQELLPSDGAAGDGFGGSVSVSGVTAVVGAPTADTSAGSDAGAGYVFVRSGGAWTEEEKLVASDADTGDLFGTSVSLSGSTVAVGAPNDEAAAGANVGSAYAFVRSGTTWTEQQKLTASDGAANDFFGFSVSISTDTLVAGAWLGDTPAGTNTGTAYVYARAGTTWTEQQELLGLDGTSSDDFGYSASVSGSSVVVGAPQDTTAVGFSAGSAYVFVRSGPSWSEQQKLTAADAAAEDRFGHSVSIDGDTAVVGARHDDTAAGVNAGSAYVFVRSGASWVQQQKLIASDAAPFDIFGSSVAVFGDTIVVGAPRHDMVPGGFSEGAAYVFVRSGGVWVQQQKLVASDTFAFDYFGTAVSISGDTILVGKPTDGGYGSAYVFVRSGATWIQQQKLAPSGPVLDRFFGDAVSVSGDTAAVGAPLDGGPGLDNAGAAYVFVRSGTFWTLQQKLVASDAGAEDRLGWSLSASGETVAVGAPYDDGAGPFDLGAVYVFVRAGTTWSEQQKLMAPDGAGGDAFGHGTAVSGDTVVAGAPMDDTPVGQNAGTAHVFRPHEVDLGMTKTDGQVTAVPGLPITYTIIASNGGPDGVTAATVADALPAALMGATWTCAASPGSSCTPSGVGGINDSVDLPVGGTVTFTLTAAVDPAATGVLANTASVAAPPGVPDVDPANDSATDVDTLAPEADLALTKTDSPDPVAAGGALSYVLGVANLGPSLAASVTLDDTLPATVAFVSSVPGPPVCTFAAGALHCDLGALAAGGTATVTIGATATATGGVLTNTATVTGRDPDTDPGNNSASATTLVGQGDGELSHGASVMLDLAAQPGPAADEDLFRISQKPRSSYEVVLDATSGDIGMGAGPFLERVAGDGTTLLQASVPIGTGPSRSLRWRNAASSAVDDQVIRVRSAGCGTDCAADDVYRLRAYETTYSVPRFNNAGTQITVLVLQNPSDYAISGEAYFQVSSGAQVAVQPFALGARGTLVLNTATVPGANGVAGTITVAHDGRYGDLSGKTVALEPATGFSFDSPLLPRPR